MQKSKPTVTLAAAIACALSATPALANDAEMMRQMKAQMARMQAQMEAMQKRIDAQETKQQRVAADVAEQKEKGGGLGKAVQVYGQARVTLDNHSGDWASGQEGTELVSNASRLGVKGEMDTALQDTSLFYLAEVRYETTDFVNGGPGSTSGAKQLEFREGFAGLKGGWGKLRLGRLSTQYKSTGTKIDPWTDNAPQARAGGRQGMSEFHSSYFNNAIDYVTPKFMGGLTASAWYSTRFDNSTKPMHNTGTLSKFLGGDAKGLGLKYNKGPLFVGVDWLDIDADSITDSRLKNDTGWQIAARYKIGPASVAAMYEDVEDLGLGKNFYLNGIYTIDKFRIIGAYGRNRDGVFYGNKDWDNLSLGVKYAVTKKSELLAAWNRRTDDTTDKDFDTFTIGVNAKFGY